MSSKHIIQKLHLKYKNFKKKKKTQFLSNDRSNTKDTQLYTGLNQIDKIEAVDEFQNAIPSKGIFYSETHGVLGELI